MTLVNKNITITILAIICLLVLSAIPCSVFAKAPERIFYTKKEKVMDTLGRVQKFKDRLAKKTEPKKKKEPKVKKAK